MSELIKTIIVDDEEHNRNIMRTLLEKYCPEIEIIGEASSADVAFEKVVIEKPQLLLLDIKMPGKSGFDLLKMFKEVTFEVVFVTAYEEYAINAFEFNALGYILKPIDYSKLENTLKKVIQRIKHKTNGHAIENFVTSINNETGKLDKVSVHHGNKVVFIQITDIIMIESHDANSIIHTSNNRKYVSSKTIKDFEEFLKFYRFFRVNKGNIINADCIVSYTKGDSCIVELKNGVKVEVSRRRKTELLEVMKGGK